MKNKSVILVIILVLIIVVFAIVLFLKSRSNVDYSIPGIDEYNNSDELTDEDREYSLLSEDTFYEDELEDYDDSNVVKNSTGKLKEAQEKYAKIELGDSKEDVIQKLGNPDDSIKDEEDPEYETLVFQDENEKYEIDITIDNGVVYSKDIFLVTGLKSNVYLSSELETNIDRIDDLATKIETEMTLEDVISILGDKYYEQHKDNDFGTWYVWCDKKEKEVSICFVDGVVDDILY